ncbi:hypothetical protein BJP36_38945 [Moorena producens JHB]|uniref:Uncharacterized protein n=1 Tax=Moorena producens (strain JHB) TaxID=1454205 RepID=A0A9Q9SUU6_MOOP1|nr:hypothetical protein [Moorena producens]WAN70047.1 hypothetical protein BJP36_38945 [Moorena producens JHB]
MRASPSLTHPTQLTFGHAIAFSDRVQPANYLQLSTFNLLTTSQPSTFQPSTC